MKYRQLMLIDDDHDDQELFVEAIREIDPVLTCAVFDGGIPALAYLEKSISAHDLIFLDLNMPIMNGSQFLEKIKQMERLRDIPVVIFSTTSNRFMLDETAALGAMAYHTKPSSYGELVKLLSDVLKG